jgi:hypothetical protein
VDEGDEPEAGETPTEWTEEQRRDFARDLAVRRRRQILGSKVFIGILAAIVAVGVLLRLDPEYWIPAVGVVALAALVFRLTNWKCPACGEGLPTRSSRSICLGCGLPLE